MRGTERCRCGGRSARWADGGLKWIFLHARLPGGEHRLSLRAGEAAAGALAVDGREKDRRALGRRLSGAFKRLHLGHRPGNWRADGMIGDLRLRLG